MTPEVGRRIGRYELLRRLGAGGMGEVYCARDHDLHRDVALKFLPERFAADPERLSRFSKEARAASSLNHPNIVTIHEIGDAGGSPFIVMELVKGDTLREIIRGGPLPTRRVLDLAVQAADGLAKAHAAGIVHRDLKPDNIMVTGDGLLKILDFGLAKLREPDEGLPDITADAPTRTAAARFAYSSEGVVMGTAGYMSPEQAAGSPLDIRSDQFALGSILYEMVTGRRAFKRDTPVQTLSAIIESEPEPVTTFNEVFPAPARWIIERCLAKDPAGRYASTADLANELRAVREHLQEVSTGATRRPRPIGSRWWTRALGVLAALVVLVLAVPSLREGLLGPLNILPLPAEKRIAVLPFRVTATAGEEQRLGDGLSDYLVARLGQLERFQRSAWVVPTAEVRQAGVTTVGAARRALGATIVVTGSLQRLDERTVVTVSLIDAKTLRQLRATTFEIVPGAVSLLERTVDAVIPMLDLEIGPEAHAALHVGGTGVAEASTLYAQALSYRPYSEARNALQRYDQEQNLERAIALFNRALERDPRYALAYAGLGEAYWRLSRFTRKPEQVLLAEQHCRRAIEIDPLVAQAWVTIGIIHAGMGKVDEAIREFQQALDREPRSADAYRELANAYTRLGRVDEATATYRRAIELKPDYWVNYSQFGAYLLRRNRPAEAEAMYRKALELVPDNTRVWSGLGAAYYYQSKFEDAKQAWQKSLELHPTSTAASNLGTRQFFEGHYADAARTFERALQIDNRDYRVWRNLAAARLFAPELKTRAGEAFAQAATLAEQERQIDPLNAEIHAALADCYANLDKPIKAKAAALEAGRLGGDEPAIASTIAGAYERMGERKAALEWIGRAVTHGLSIDEVEQSPGLAALRADPRYQALIKQNRPKRNEAAR